MLLIVCPNLAMDRILEVPNFRTTIVQRSVQTTTQPGGKGINAARVFRELGGEVVLTGFVGRDCSAQIAESLKKIDIQYDAVEAFPETRVCTLILDGRNHPTVINEESMDVDSHAAELLLNVVDKWMPRAAAVLGTGSLSRGLSNDFFRYVLERARSVGKFTALDTTGPALAEGVQAKPGFLKLNAPEFAQFSGVSSPRTESVRDYLRKFGSDLAHHTAITFGEVGAILHVNGQLWQAAPPQVFTANPIGAGDAFAAGYLHEFLASGDAERSFRCGLAAGASDANSFRPGEVNASEIRILEREVHVEQL
jgi:1-phosphofructokinase family hexose kinase